MTDPHRHTGAAVAACLAAGLLLAACSKSTPAAQTTSAVQTTAAATDATSDAATNAASAQATPLAASTAGGNACSLVTEADTSPGVGHRPLLPLLVPSAPTTRVNATTAPWGARWSW